MIVKETVIGDCRLLLGDCRPILSAMPAGSVGAVICDPPFSERVHQGHDTVAARSGDDEGYDGAARKPLGYGSWSPNDAAGFISVASHACHGWIVCLCDWRLFGAYYHAAEALGRYAFPPLPWYAPGSRCRLSGDGPSSWTDWIFASRTARQHRWGTLPGGYTPKAGYGEHRHMGGKPLGLMVELVRDYSKPGDLVCDPCVGSGTTLIAASLLGRRSLGIEIDPATYEKAVARVREAHGKGSLFEHVTTSLFEECSDGQEESSSPTDCAHAEAGETD